MPQTQHQMMRHTLRTFAAAILALGFAATANAGERRFTYSYETTTAPKGSWEYEQWMTWKSYDNKDRFDFRHEIEYGITDTLQLGIYLADWRYEDVDGEGSE